MEFNGRSYYLVMLIYLPNFNKQACNFIDAAALSVESDRIILNELTKSLIITNLWDLAYLINPVIGGLANSHKYNLKDPRDDDTAYRLTFYGTINHTTTGMAGNGIDGYYLTNLNEDSIMTLNDMSVFVYLRTNLAMNTAADITTAAVAPGTTVISRNATNNFTARCQTSTTSSDGVSDSLGLFGLSRLAAANYKKYKNTTEFNRVATSTGKSNSAFIGMRASSTYNNREQAFIWIGKGVTTAQQALLYNIVQTYQTQLGRQV
jgi:hypothetical protein